MSKSRTLDELNKTTLAYRNFLNKVKKVNDIVPVVKQNLDFLEFTVDTIKNAPEDLKPLFDSTPVINAAKSNTNFVETNLPKIQIGSMGGGAGTLNAGNATITSAVVGAINNNNNSYSRNAWAATTNENYFNLQSKYDRPKEIENILNKFMSIKDFQDSCNLLSKMEVGVCDPRDVAFAMRNVLEKLVGNLLEIARKGHILKISKSDKWKFIASNIGKGTLDGDERKLLSERKDTFDKIKSELTDLAKNNPTNARERTKKIYIEWIDFIYIVLNLIEPAFLENKFNKE